MQGHKSQTNINNGRRTPRSSGSGSSNHGSYDPYNKGKSGWCFITTAACEYFGKSDDCYELTMLRMFRDGWLLEQPEGKELVKEYYRIAPAIVSQLDNSDKRGDIYNEIWIKYIIPCVRLIEQNAYIPCCNLYKQMVQKLETLLRGE